MLVGTLVLILGLTSPDQKALPDQKTAQAPSPLARARDAYNAGEYDQAIRFASDARAAADPRTRPPSCSPGRTSSATARRSPRSTCRARAEALKGVGDARSRRPTTTSTSSGSASRCYYEERFGAAAECFARARPGRRPVDRRRAKVCSTGGPARSISRRRSDPKWIARAIYQRIFDKAGGGVPNTTIDRPPPRTGSAAAARGADDLERAWAAAIAGWVRAPSTGGVRRSLRADLDRLMTLAIIPERARRQLPTGDLQLVIQRLTGEWQDVKTWGK